MQDTLNFVQIYVYLFTISIPWLTVNLIYEMVMDW
jgi:hypothetical protein